MSKSGGAHAPAAPPSSAPMKISNTGIERITVKLHFTRKYILLFSKEMITIIQGGQKQICYGGGARLNKKNEMMKLLQILEIFTK